MKRGLVLEGGGAKGAFHCGAVMALYDYGYQFDGVAGTSIGAINSALIAQDCGYDSMLRMWEHINASMFTHFDDGEVEKLFNKDFDVATVAYWSKQALKIVKNLGVPTDKIIPFLKKNISEERVRNSKMDMAIVTYSITDRAPVEIFIEDIPQGELYDYIFASAYYPAFRLKRLHGKYYIDGGVYDNMPIALLAKKGYDEIFAIRTMSKMPYNDACDDSVKINYICPSEDLGGTVEISHKMVNRNIKLGYYDSMKFLRGYDGIRYYFSTPADDIVTHFNNKLLQKYDLIAPILKIASDKPEEVFNKTYEYLNKSYKNKNLDSVAMQKFIEEYAMELGVEKFYVYKPNDFIEELYAKYNGNKFDDTKSNIFTKEKVKKDTLFKILMEDKNEG